MTKLSRLARLIVAVAALFLTLDAHLVPTARAADSVRDIVLGAEVSATLDVNDVHGFRLPTLAGTSLRIRLRAENEHESKDVGPLPTFVLLDPTAGAVGSGVAEGSELRVTALLTGTYYVEVRAGEFSGEYELSVDGSSPEPTSSSMRVTVSVGSAPVTVHLDARAHSTVELDVRRRSGDRPRVDAITDGLGRALTVYVKRARGGRVRLESVPVGVDGGLDVTLSADGTRGGTYELRAEIRGTTERPRGGDDRDGSRIVVLLAPGADAAQVAASLGFTLVEVRGNLAVFDTGEDREGFEDDDADSAHQLAEVLDAEPDLRAGLPEGSQTNAGVVGSDLGRGDVETQPALVEIRGALAHKRATGTGIVVAVLDTGIDGDHPYFVGRILPGRDVVDSDDDPSEMTDGFDDDQDGLIDEGYGHGTCIASLVLAAAPDAKVLPVRVLGTDGVGRVSDIATGITWAADQGADVVNLSLGMLGGSTTVASAVRYAQARGVVVVAATGNGGMTNVVEFPAAMSGVIAVTALAPDRTRATFANVGASTTLAAPGVDIIGAYPLGRYATWSGTSFATALASGGAGLFAGGAPGVSAAQMVKTIASRARRLPLPLAQRNALGSGELDLLRLTR